MTNFDDAPIEVRRAYDSGKWWGAYEERERIIVLLEAQRCGYLRCPDETCRNCEIPVNEVIALIKGDNK